MIPSVSSAFSSYCCHSKECSSGSMTMTANGTTYKKTPPTTFRPGIGKSSSSIYLNTTAILNTGNRNRINDAKKESWQSTASSFASSSLLHLPPGNEYIHYEKRNKNKTKNTEKALQRCCFPRDESSKLVNDNIKVTLIDDSSHYPRNVDTDDDILLHNFVSDLFSKIV